MQPETDGSNPASIRAYALVFDAGGTQVLVEPESSARLPYVDIRPRFYPEVEEFVQKLEERCGVPVTVLRCIDRGDSNTHRPRVYSAVIRADCPLVDTRIRWTGVGDLGQFSDLPGGLSESVRSEYDRLFSEATAAIYVPWQRPSDWRRHVDQWIEDRLPWSGGLDEWEITQVRSWSISSVLRVRRDGRRLFFKAAPPYFASEVAVTADVASRFPNVSPRPLATDSARGWMLSDDLGDVTYARVDGLPMWCRAMEALADIEIAYTARLCTLRSIGLQVRRISTIEDVLTRWLADPSALALQYWGSRTTDVLDRLRPHVDRIGQMCQHLEGLSLPPTLDHGDLDAGNIFVRNGSPVFMDWSDASISHPFFTPAMIRQVTRSPEISEAFLRAWTDYGSLAELSTGFQAARVLAPLERAVHYYQNIIPYLIRPSVELYELERYIPDLLGLSAKELDQR